jgi:hypothetical protein
MLRICFGKLRLAGLPLGDCQSPCGKPAHEFSNPGGYPLTMARTIRSKSALPTLTETEASSLRKNQRTVHSALAAGASLL